MLWNRADSNIEPSVYDQSAPATSSSSPKAASVTLVARDDRDLGDEADASSGRPDASAAADDSATSTSRKRDQAEVSRSAAEEQANQPPSQARRAYISASTDPFTGDCPVCMVEYVSGQITCTTCGFEPLDESGQVKVQPNRRSRLLERRLKKSNEFGIYGDVNSSLLQAITEEQGEQLRQTMGVRGLTSIEAATIRESPDATEEF